MGLHLDLLIKKVWFCVFVFALIRRCSLEEATLFQMKEKKKEEAVSHILYFSFSGLTSMFLESSSSGVAMTSLFRT